MTIATRAWGIRTLLASVMCIVAMGIAGTAAKPAEAAPAQVKGGQATLAVNLDTLVAPMVDRTT
jgi:hypothetical protein